MQVLRDLPAAAVNIIEIDFDCVDLLAFPVEKLFPLESGGNCFLKTFRRILRNVVAMGDSPGGHAASAARRIASHGARRTASAMMRLSMLARIWVGPIGSVLPLLSLLLPLFALLAPYVLSVAIPALNVVTTKSTVRHQCKSPAAHAPS